MAVFLSPDDALRFDRLKDATSQATLKVQNRNKFNIAFKVKTTDCKNYLSKPNNGILKSGESTYVIIHVSAEKMRDQPCKDKLLIQSIVVDSELDESSTLKIWKTARRDQIFDHRLRVEYSAADETENILQSIPWFTSSVRERWKDVSNFASEGDTTPLGHTRPAELLSLAFSLWPDKRLEILGDQTCDSNFSWMMVCNDSKSPIAFKIYTSVKGRYTVRPNMGRVPVGRTMLIQVAYNGSHSGSFVDKLRVNSVLIVPDLSHLAVPVIFDTLGAVGSQYCMSSQKLEVAYCPRRSRGPGSITTSKTNMRDGLPSDNTRCYFTAKMQVLLQEPYYVERIAAG